MQAALLTQIKSADPKDLIQPLSESQPPLILFQLRIMYLLPVVLMMTKLRDLSSLRQQVRTTMTHRAPERLYLLHNLKMDRARPTIQRPLPDKSPQARLLVKAMMSPAWLDGLQVAHPVRCRVRQPEMARARADLECSHLDPLLISRLLQEYQVPKLILRLPSLLYHHPTQSLPPVPNLPLLQL